MTAELVDRPARTMRVRTAVVALAVAALPWTALQSVAPAVIPAVEHDLRIPASAATWVLTGYLLVGVLSTVVAGALPAAIGGRRALIGVLAIAAIASVVSALSFDFWSLVISRSVQGVSAAAIPLSYALAKRDLPDAAARRAVGAISAVFGLGGVFGLALAGPLVDLLSYRSLFAGAAGVLVLALVLTLVSVAGDGEVERRRFSVTSLVLLGIGLSALLLGLDTAGRDGWGTWPVWALGALAAAGIVGWALWERRTTRSLVDIRLLTSARVWPPVTISLLLGGAMFAGFVLIPQVVTNAAYGLGGTATLVGLVLLPSSIATFFGSLLVPVLPRTFSHLARLGTGGALIALSYLLLAVWHRGYMAVAGAGVVQGIGVALAVVSIMTVLVEGLTADEVGKATGLATVGRLIGGALGSQLVVVAVTIGIAESGSAETGFVVGSILAAVLAIVTVPLAIVARRLRIPSVPPAPMA